MRGAWEVLNPECCGDVSAFMFAQEMLARSKHLEDGLITLCGEKSLLECELNKMHAGSGRSIQERRRKAEVQQRLELVGKEISGLRIGLKKLTGKWVSGK